MKKSIIYVCIVGFNYVIGGNLLIAQATNKLEPTGSVGIGTVTPTTLLHVAGTITTNNGSSGVLTSGAAPRLVLQTVGVNRADFTPTNTQFTDASAMTTLDITSGGVGIGTTSPSQALEVNGNIRLKSFSHALLANNINSISNGIDLTMTGGNAANIKLQTNGTGIVYIPSGKVGIGTDNPLDLLSVNGTIRAKKIRITQLEWSDYVFDNEYKLRSLYSLESFIKKNKHLPEIPPAKEVKERGISVGDSQALLLKKIEELTLYVIAQQKEINLLKLKITAKCRK